MLCALEIVTVTERRKRRERSSFVSCIVNGVVLMGEKEEERKGKKGFAVSFGYGV